MDYFPARVNSEDSSACCFLLVLSSLSSFLMCREWTALKTQEPTADLRSCLTQRLFSATLPGTLTPLASLDSWFFLLIPVRPLTLPGCSSPVTSPREWAGTAGEPISFVPLSHKSLLCCCCPLSEKLVWCIFLFVFGFLVFYPPYCHGPAVEVAIIGFKQLCLGSQPMSSKGEWKQGLYLWISSSGNSSPPPLCPQSSGRKTGEGQDE